MIFLIFLLNRFSSSLSIRMPKTLSKTKDSVLTRSPHEGAQQISQLIWYTKLCAFEKGMYISVTD